MPAFGQPVVDLRDLQVDGRGVLVDRCAVLAEGRKQGVELSLQHAELRVDVVELFGRCGPVPEQVFHTLPFGALLGDLLAQRGGLFGDVGSGGGDRGALALELPALQGELQGVDAADGPIRPEPVAQLCVEREDASGGFG